MPSKATIKHLRKLRHKKHRQETQEFIIEGEKTICELLESNWQIIHLYATQNFIDKHQNLIHHKNAQQNFPTTPTSAENLTKIGNLTNNNQALAHLAIPNQTPQATKSQTTLALDQINDPGNLGTIVRLADWYGITQIICSPNSVDLYNPKTLQATKGSFLRVGVVYQDLEDHLQNQTTPIYGASLEGQSIHQLTNAPQGTLLLGNESHGISPKLTKYITHQITIPKFGKAESLNVATACGILLDNLARITPKKIKTENRL